MITQKKAMILLCILVTVALAGQGRAQTGNDQPVDMVFAWEAPTTGSPVVKYEVQVRRGGMLSSDVTTREAFTPEIVIPVDWLTLYEVRVRGVDAAGVRGPWSGWSLAEDRDRGAPGF